MNSIFFKPENGWVGDCMPCYHDGLYYMYYQCDKRIPRPFPDGEPFGWSLAVSKDLLHFNDYGEVLHKGENGSREHCLYAGTVIYAEGKFRAFYTGECKYYLGHEDLPPKEVLMLAESDDGISWVKKEKQYSAPYGFEKDYFRDPFIFHPDTMDRWIMLVAAQKKGGAKKRKGVLLYYTSRNLADWTYEGVFYDPDQYFLLQMPDLFKIGDWWYLLFSELDDKRQTRYLMSKSLFGPWAVPSDDCFDGRCFYAARSVEAEGKRVLFGWNPTRKNNDDLELWMWGGNAVQHEICQRKNGTLAVHPVLSVSNALKSRKQGLPEKLQLSRIDGNSEIILCKQKSNVFRLEADGVYESETARFGLKIYENSEEDLGYEFQFSPVDGKFLFDKTPNYPWFRCMNRGLERPFPVKSGKKFHITLFVDHDIAVLYLDDIALSVRMAQQPGCEIKFYVQNGSVSWNNICICE